MSERGKRSRPSVDGQARPLEICLVYDRLYPWSIGGAERWYRRLAERLADEGHRVTYVTTRHWPATERPEVPGVRVVALGSENAIYGGRRRRIAPLMMFGGRVWGHLFRDGGDYDVVHGSAMSTWSALAAVSLARKHDYRLVLDWWEVWSRTFWREYAGAVPGLAGWSLQRLTAKLPHAPITYSRLHAARLQRLRKAGSIPIMRGLLPASALCQNPERADPLVVYVGRHIEEKQVPAIVPALAIAREWQPTLRTTLFGDGPDTDAVRRAVSATGLDGIVDFPGFVDEGTLLETLGRALCLVLLSRREGYGLVVAEAAALGVPSIVVRHPDSAASELIAEGVNGFLCGSTDPREIAAAILRIHDAGDRLRQSTRDWFCQNRGELTIDGTLPRLLAIYRGEIAGEQSGT